MLQNTEIAFVNIVKLTGFTDFLYKKLSTATRPIKTDILQTGGAKNLKFLGIKLLLQRFIYLQKKLALLASSKFLN